MFALGSFGVVLVVRLILYFKAHRMHELRTTAIDDHGAWASVSLSVTRETVLTHS